MHKYLLLVIALCLPGIALAQGTPGFTQGQIPSATQWNSAFGRKTDVTGGTLTNGNINSPTMNGTIGGSPSVGGIWSFQNALILDNWATANRPVSPSAGALGFNSQLGTIDLYNGTIWQNPSTFLGGSVPNATEFVSGVTFDSAVGGSGAFSVPVSLSTVTATGGSKTRTLADHFADVVQVKDFGTNPAATVCNGTSSSDDGAAFNAALTFVKANYAPAGKPHALIVWPPGTCYIGTTMDITGIQGDNKLVVTAYGTRFLGNTTGLPMVDCTQTQYCTWFGGHFLGDATNIPTTAFRLGRGCPAGAACQGANAHIADIEVNGSFKIAGCYLNQAEASTLSNVVCNSNYPTAAQLLADPTAQGAAGYMNDGYSLFWAAVGTVYGAATDPGIGSNVGVTVEGSSQFSANGVNPAKPGTAIWIGNTYGHTFTGANYAVTSGAVGGAPVTLYTASGGVNYNLHLGDMHKEQPSSTYPAIMFTGTLLTQNYYGLQTNDPSCCGTSNSYLGLDTSAGLTLVRLTGADVNIANPNGFTGVFSDATKFDFSGHASLGTDVGGTKWNLPCVSGIGNHGTLGARLDFEGSTQTCVLSQTILDTTNGGIYIGPGPLVTGDNFSINAARNLPVGMTVRNAGAFASASSEIRLGNSVDNFQTRLTLNGTSNSNGNGAGTTRLLGAGGLYLESGTGPVYAPTSPLVVGSTKFTTSGCSVSATTGNGTAGTYTSGTTGACSVVVTMNGATGMTAPNGWVCMAFDQTTPANAQLQTASSTTTATIAGTTTSGDVVAFACQAY